MAGPKIYASIVTADGASRGADDAPLYVQLSDGAAALDAATESATGAAVPANAVIEGAEVIVSADGVSDSCSSTQPAALFDRISNPESRNTSSIGAFSVSVAA